MVTVDRQSKYYRDLWRRAKNFHVRFTQDAWWDMWHMHFDWDGEGNKGRWARREHLRAMWRAFANLRAQARRQCSTKCQVFLNICASDSAADGVYLHTPNPNGDNFPYSFGDSAELAYVPPLLAGIVDLSRYAIRKEQFQDVDWYVIIQRDP